VEVNSLRADSRPARQDGPRRRLPRLPSRKPLPTGTHKTTKRVNQTLSPRNANRVEAQEPKQCSLVMTSEEAVLFCHCNPPICPLDTISIHLDAAIYPPPGLGGSRPHRPWCGVDTRAYP
jgi:hypothetical protein